MMFSNRLIILPFFANFENYFLCRMEFNNINVYEEASKHDYVRMTFAPHGKFDIFGHDDNEIEEFLSEFEKCSVKVADIHVDKVLYSKPEKILPKVWFY